MILKEWLSTKNQQDSNLIYFFNKKLNIFFIYIYMENLLNHSKNNTINSADIEIIKLYEEKFSKEQLLELIIVKAEPDVYVLYNNEELLKDPYTIKLALNHNCDLAYKTLTIIANKPKLLFYANKDYVVTIVKNIIILCGNKLQNLINILQSLKENRYCLENIFRNIFNKYKTICIKALGELPHMTINFTFTCDKKSDYDILVNKGYTVRFRKKNKINNYNNYIAKLSNLYGKSDNPINIFNYMNDYPEDCNEIIEKFVNEVESTLFLCKFLSQLQDKLNSLFLPIMKNSVDLIEKKGIKIFHIIVKHVPELSSIYDNYVPNSQVLSHNLKVLNYVDCTKIHIQTLKSILLKYGDQILIDYPELKDHKGLKKLVKESSIINNITV